jgi:hypothetical protein
VTHSGINIDLCLELSGFHKVLMHKPDVCDNLDSAVHIASVPEILQACRTFYYLALL